MNEIILKLDMIQNQLRLLEVQLTRVLEDIKAGTGYDPGASQRVFGTEILGWHTPLSKES